jgi:hypothetical protein
MFGSANRLEKKLREGGGHAASAEVVEAKAGRMVNSHGSTAAEELATSTVTWTLKVHVTPDGEAPFDADFKAPFPQMGGPTVGETLGVLYDPNDRTKLVVDHSSRGVATRAVGRMSPEAQAALSSAGDGESAQDLLQERLTDPAAFAAKMRAGRSGPGVMTGGQQVSGTPVAAATPTDPADEIAKLADLRDRGALTEAEFEAQKKRVLGS